jgi:hypothetical protein
MSSAAATSAPSRITGRAFALPAALFLLAAAGVAAARIATPFDKGWWLVAYLGLVGGVAQLLLGSGLGALAGRAGAREPARRVTLAQFGLWNAGTLTVAVADLVEAPAAVLAGSVLLLVALALFAVELRRIARTPLRGWAAAYVALVVFLAGSVAVGAALAEALPGQ